MSYTKIIDDSYGVLGAVSVVRNGNIVHVQGNLTVLQTFYSSAHLLLVNGIEPLNPQSWYPAKIVEVNFGTECPSRVVDATITAVGQYNVGTYMFSADIVVK